jgi:hypothetical protein
LTQDNPGSFTLRSLPTPATLTLLVSKASFATQSLTLTLAPGQQLTGVVVTLSGGAGSISGTVFLASDGSPAGGVGVQVSNGSITLQTVTLSVGAVGTFQVTGLPVPSTYTITFSRPDLASITQAVDLDPFGQRDVANVNGSMPDATGSVSGTVTEVLTGFGIGEVDVSLSDGATTFRTKSETKPLPSDSGRYFIGGIKPGTYTLTFNRRGATPVSVIVSIGAGQPLLQNAVVGKPASITGSIDFIDNLNVHQPLIGAEVRLFVLSQYPNTVLTRTTTTVPCPTPPSPATAACFSFTDLVAPESYLLEFAYPAGAPAQTTRTLFTVKPGETRQVATVTLAA